MLSQVDAIHGKIERADMTLWRFQIQVLKIVELVFILSSDILDYTDAP